MIIDHVQIAIPQGGEPSAREFFGGVLGMDEDPKPEALAERGGCWFRRGGCSIHVGIDPDFAPQRKGHPAFAVDDLHWLAERLVAAGHEVRWDSAIPQVVRFYVDDPFGNRLEFLDSAAASGSDASVMDPHLSAAHQQAVNSLEEGGFPVGSVIVKDGQLIGAGCNRYAQTGDPTTHAEMEAIRDAAARAGEAPSLDLLVGATCYTTMMPCEMCSGAIIRFGLAAVVVAEVSSYEPADTRGLLEARGIRVEIRDEEACKATVELYYAEHPQARGASRPSDHRWP